MENENIDINIRPLTIRIKTFKDITDINISPNSNFKSQTYSYQKYKYTPQIQSELVFNDLQPIDYN